MSNRKQITKPAAKRTQAESAQTSKAKKPKIVKTNSQNEAGPTNPAVGGNEVGLPPKIVKNVECLGNPVKSEYDENEYRVIKLPNDLIVFLIAASTSSSGGGSSKNEKQDISGSCELCINVGRFSDPPEIPRLTEYLPYLLSKGSLTDLQSKFSCATGCEQTTFRFSEENEHNFYQTLVSFGQLFTDPRYDTFDMADLMKKADRKINTERDPKLELLSSLIKPEHPGSKLVRKTADAQRNVTDNKLTKKLITFKERHYSAHRMTVTIRAQLSLDTLEKYAVKCFSNIPSNRLPPDDFSKFKGIDPFVTPGSPRIYTITSTIGTLDSEPRFNVELRWTMPPARDHYKIKPHVYLARILRHEGEGCLFEYLEKKAWCEDVSCTVGQDSLENNSLYTTLVLALRMTPEGRQNFAEILSVIYSYINLIRKEGPQKRIHDELRLTEWKKFRLTREATDPRILERGEIPRLYPPSDYVTGDVLYFEYDPSSIQACIDALTPERTNIILYKVDRTCPGSSDGLPEPKVTTTAVSEDVITYWKAMDSIPDLHLPKANAFITEDYPVNIHKDDCSEIWYQRATESEDCNTYMNMHCVIPLPLESAEKAVKLEVFVGFLNQLLSVQLNTTSEAHHEIHRSPSGLWIGVWGCDKKSPILLRTITMYIAGCWYLLTEHSFDVVKNDLLTRLRLSLMDPTKLAVDLEQSITRPNHWSYDEMHTALINLRYDLFGEYVKHFTDCMFIQCFVRGIMTKAVAIENVQKCAEILNSQTLLPTDFPQDSVNPIPRGTRCCRVENFDLQCLRSIVLNHYEFESPWFGLSVIAKVFCVIMQTALPREGLSVEYCSAGETGYTLRSVRSQQNNVEEIDENIETFRKSWNKKFKEIPKISMVGLKKDVLKTKVRECTDIDRDPKKIVGANWNEIMSRQYLFERRVRELLGIDEMTNENLKMWMTKFTMSPVGRHLRKLTIQIVQRDIPTESSLNMQQAENRKLGINTKSISNSIEYSLRFLTRVASDKKKRRSTYYIANHEELKRGFAYCSK